jgi:hypothetical protein
LIHQIVYSCQNEREQNTGVREDGKIEKHEWAESFQKPSRDNFGDFND